MVHDLNTEKPGKVSYDPVYFKYLAAIEKEHFWFRTRNTVIRELVRQTVMKFQPGFRVMEIGCGTGNVLDEITNVCQDGLVIGVDLFLQGLRFARDQVTNPLVQADLFAMPFHEKFNMICLFDVIEHLPNDEEVLRKMMQMLTPGGYLFITVPAHPSLWSYFDESAHHCRRYELAELQTKLANTGFKIEFLTHYMSLSFPLVWLSRKLHAGIRKPGTLSMKRANELTMAELKITPLVNPLLTWLYRKETDRLAKRYELPFGTSLLALAQKPMD